MHHASSPLYMYLRCVSDLPLSLFPDRSRVCRARSFPMEGESAPDGRGRGG